MSVKESISLLRARVFVLKGMRTVDEISGEIGLSAKTVREWLRGSQSVTTTTLECIEEWCDAQDAATEEHPHAKR